MAFLGEEAPLPQSYLQKAQQLFREDMEGAEARALWLLRFGWGSGRSGSGGSFRFGRFEFADKFGWQFYFFRREVFNGDEVICRFGQDRAFVRYDILHGFFSFHFFSFRLGFRFRSFSLEVQFRLFLRG